MKIRKNANQKNVVLNKYFYNEVKIKELLDFRCICFFDDWKECYDYSEYVRRFREDTLRIFLEDGDEIKVELDENGMYTNVLIKSNGNKYYINL